MSNCMLIFLASHLALPWNANNDTWKKRTAQTPHCWHPGAAHIKYIAITAGSTFRSTVLRLLFPLRDYARSLVALPLPGCWLRTYDIYLLYWFSIAG